MHLTSTITVPQTIEQVWNFLSDPRNANKWDRSIKDVMLPPSGFTGLGCTVETITPSGMHQSFIVTEFDPLRKFTFKLLESSMFKSATLSFSFQQIKEGVKIIHDIDIKLHLRTFFLYPILLITNKKALRRDMEYLREALDKITTQ